MTILHGDCLEVLRSLPDGSVDAVVTDPPYGLSFMGKRWDYDVPSEAIWRECLRVLKPGGHLLAFAGTRTQHRMAVRIEDAGFEIRDMIAWLYGNGFPKSHNLKDEWAGWGTALKPALEPITVARKPFAGTVAANVQAHGTGAINIDASRVSGPKPDTTRGAGGQNGITSPRNGQGRILDDGKGRWPANLIHDGSEEVVGLFPVTTSGNWNGQKKGVAFQHNENGQPYHWAGDTGSAARFFKECDQWQDQSPRQSSADIAEQSLSLQSVIGATVQSVAATWPSLAGIVSSASTEPFTSATPSECESIAAVCTAAMTLIASGCLPESQLEKRTPSGSLAKVAVSRSQTGITTIMASLWKSDGSVGHATFSITPTSLDRGESASRFRYCAKASKRDRDEGCEGLDAKRGGALNMRTDSHSQANGMDTGPRANHHPTVKPTDLMRYLCRLVTPPGGVVLDPFMGSGSTGKAAALEGFQFIGIEREAEYIEIARARIAAVTERQQEALFA